MNRSLKTVLWRTAIAVAILAILLGAFYADQNARGLNRWKQIEHEINARGVSVNWDDYIPTMPPTNDNFFAAPMMAEWFQRKNGSSAPVTSVPLGNLLDNPDNIVDLIDGSSASNYLAWCAPFDSHFKLIREALSRPTARLVGDYRKPSEVPIPNFVTYRALGQVLAHRAKCHLVLDQPDRALEDLTLLYALNRALVQDGKPIVLVTPMVHTAILQPYVNAIARGLDARALHEPELAVLQRQLANIHLLPLLVTAFETERAAACRQVDSSIDDLLRSPTTPRQLTQLGWQFIPRGWMDENKVLVAEIEEQMIEAIDATNQTVSPTKALATNIRANNAFQHTRPWNFIAAICIPNFSKAAETVAREQTWVDQARIVCALERYRLHNGQYPPTLATLVPQFIDKIPNDVITGKPMNYARKDDQDFLLYSVGWNEVDDGGITARNGDGSEDRDRGDWVWHYPEL